MTFNGLDTKMRSMSLTKADQIIIRNIFNEAFEAIVLPRLDAIDERLDRVEERLDKVEARLDKVEVQLKALTVEVKSTKSLIAEPQVHTGLPTHSH